MNIKNKKMICKIIAVLAIIIIVIILLLKGCSGTKQYTIKFDTAGAGNIVDIKVDENAKAIKPKNPTREGYVFDGWYVNDEEFDFNNPITEDLQLEAHWSKVKYKITIKLDNGQTINEEVEYEDILDLKTPKRNGYKFLGWYVDDEEFDINTKITKDMTIEAKWEKDKNESTIPQVNQAKYVVEHYLMNTKGEYSNTPYMVEELFGIANKEIEVKTKEFLGFIAPKTKKVVISEDGTTLVQYFYERNKYELKVTGDNGVLETIGTDTYYYEEEFKISYTLKAGYDFVSLSEEMTKMPAKDLEIKITTKAKDDTPYIIEHYFMNVEGNYKNVEAQVEEAIGTTDAQIAIIPKELDGFTYVVNEEKLTINGDGSTVVKVYYERNKYELEVTGDKGILKTTGVGTYYYEEEVNIEATLKDGYSFGSWSNGDTTLTTTYKMNASKEQEISATTIPNTYHLNINYDGGNVESENKTTYTVEDDFTLNEPTKQGYVFDHWLINDKESDGHIINSFGDLTIKAIYTEATDTLYKVEHYFMDVEGSYQNVEAQEVDENQKGRTNSVATYTLKNIEGFEFDSKETGDIPTINADGTTVVKIYYKRLQYNLTINGDEHIENASGTGTYYYGAKVEIKATPKVGYDFDKWSNNINENPYTYTVTAEEEQTLTAISKPGDHTKYVVKHILMDVNGSYDESNPYLTEECFGRTASYVTPNTLTSLKPEVGDIKGFIIPEKQKIQINAEGTTELIYLYKRKTVDLVVSLGTYSKGLADVLINNESYNKFIENGEHLNPYQVYYQSKLTIEPQMLEGYKFKEWIITGLTKNEDGTYIVGLSDINIEAVCEQIIYKINYHLEEGSLPSDIPNTYEVTYGNFAPNLNPIYEGHKFMGWYTESTFENLFDFTTKITKDYDLYGKWDIEEETLVFETNGGSKISPKKIPFGEDINISDIEDPTKTGYTFEGWYNDRNLQDKFENDTKLMPSTGWKLYAKWTPNNYIVKFEGNGNDGETAMDSQEFTYDIPQQLNSNTYTKTGYHFVGWKDETNNQVYENNQEVSNLVVKGEITLKAIWEANPYTIEYYGADGTLITSQQATYDEEIEFEPEPEKKKQFTITYNYNYGDNQTETEQIDAIFICWTLDKEGNGDCVNNKNKNLTAQNNGIVKLYSKWGGTTKDIDKVLSRTGYKFNGWSTQKTGKAIENSNNYPIANDVELYALWNENHATITYYGNNNYITNKEETFTQNLKYTDLIELSTNQFYYTINYDLNYGDNSSSPAQVKDGFKYWSDTTNDSNGQYLAATLRTRLETENDIKINLYAIWEDEITIDLLIPERNGYVFGGWSTDVDSATTGAILGYKSLKGTKEETFTGEYSYAKKATIEANKILVENEISTTSTRTLDNTLYAIWWEIPYIKSLYFDYENEENGAQTQFNISDKSHYFYFAIPNSTTGYVNVLSVNVDTTNSIILNNLATQSSEFGDVNFDGSTLNVGLFPSTVKATGLMYAVNGIKLPLIAKEGSNNTSWIIDSKNLDFVNIAFKEIDGFQGKNFHSLLLNGYSNTKLIGSISFKLTENKELGIANKFGCNGLACTPHYGSTYVANLNGYNYFFFGVTSKVDGKDTLDKSSSIVYKIDGVKVAEIKNIPAGSPIPNLGSTVTSTITNKTYNNVTWNIGNPTQTAKGENVVNGSCTQATAINTTKKIAIQNNNDVLISQSQLDQIKEEIIPAEVALPPQAPEVVGENLDEEMPDNELSNIDEDEEEKNDEMTSYPLKDEIIQDEDYNEKHIEPE